MTKRSKEPDQAETKKENTSHNANKILIGQKKSSVLGEEAHKQIPRITSCHWVEKLKLLVICFIN
jgi:hypothetical protein